MLLLRLLLLSVSATARPQCVTNATLTPEVYFTRYAQESQNPSSRVILLDLGANYANTLRVYADSELEDC